jgi:trimeric autotransporter adhesin
MILVRRLVFAALWATLAAAQTVYVDKVAGVGAPTNFGGDFGPATKAQLNDPVHMALDPAGNLYIADEGNSRIRKIAPNGTITTLAGTKGFYTGYFSGDGGPALAAGMDTSYDVALDGAGNLYIAAYGNSRVLKVNSAGTLTTFAGTGLNVLGGDGGAATAAGIGGPTAVAADASGNVYIADYTFGVVRRVSSDGIITTIAGTGVPGYSGDNGLATSAQLGGPVALVVAGDGTIYIADYPNNRVRAMSPGGTIRTVAGTGVAGYSGDGGLATSAQLNGPSGLSLDGSGNLYIADSNNYRVRRVTSGGVVSTVAGTGTQGFSGDGGLATSANLDTPMGVLADAGGNLYIADSGNNRIRLVGTNGGIRTIAGSRPFSEYS